MKALSVGLDAGVAQGAGGVDEAQDVGRADLEHVLEGLIAIFL